MQNNTTYTAGLYLRLSKDDESQGESVSIGTQRAILTDYCLSHQFAIYREYIDDGYSGLNFERPGFRALLEDVERGVINLVLTKDLSRLGRDYIMTGYYSEIFFQTKGVRYIALADDFDTVKGNNDIAPFKNILNDMYARDVSRKVKNAKHQRAKQGFYVGSQTPYGYCINPQKKGQLAIDPEAADTVKLIYQLAEEGLGGVAIAARLEEQKILTPSVYKHRKGDSRFSDYPTVKAGQLYKWRPTTVGHILTDPVYTGTLISLKTEVTNCKTKQRVTVPDDQRIVTREAHPAIITQAQFERIRDIRASHRCPANIKRLNMFRGLLYCDCCGHPLAISQKQLLAGKVDMYLCMHHYHNPAECPKTHRVYHEMLYTYVLQQIRYFAKSMKRRRVNSAIAQYADISELTPEVLQQVIRRIEVGHVTSKSRPGNVISIDWKLDR